MSDDIDKAIDLKIQIERLIESEVGDYLEEAREQDEREAVLALLALNPFDAKFTQLSQLQSEIAKIQENVMLARKVNTYFANAILNGNQAEELLSSEEEMT